ncbi:lysylphosphatidylglycerol synthase transmembrane domain-containing protein [Paractinoplanes durhamensis]|uniref:lysylphosphatidylglycerol synthase transmembrane domain-containing protein n=1 Tax=Paractinoplanes durhamensis TaxID=113563 RepID=UPI001EF261E0|nr:lysylphosphatidylglycerol synthase transmembrane domain-containing protein [Actinoplanes durhamensis]
MSPALRWWRRLRLPLLIAAGLALAALGLWGRMPDPRDFLGALTSANYWWVTAAAALQATSLAAFAWQQRQLLRALGVRLTARRAAAVTLARTAISISMPAGAAVSAGYAVREYQRGGVSKELSAASMIVSGLASIGGLTLLYVTGGLAVLGRNPALLLSPRPLAVVAVLAILTTAAILAGRRLPAFKTRATRDGRVIRWIRATLTSARDAWQAGASLRARDWIAGLLFFAVNWLTDLLCLAATCRAVGLPVGVTTLAGIYLGVQIVRQVPLTPGGVGVVDTALVAGLTAAGAGAASAVAAVLIYRLISCWLLLPVGGLAALALRRNDLQARRMMPRFHRPRRRATRP